MSDKTDANMDYRRSGADYFGTAVVRIKKAIEEIIDQYDSASVEIAILELVDENVLDIADDLEESDDENSEDE